MHQWNMWKRQGRARKKKPRMASSGQHKEMEFSQSVPTPSVVASTPEPFVPPPAPPPPARFRAKQPIVRPPIAKSAIPKDPQAFTFILTPGFKPIRKI
ncbi:hypothetical protein PIB30_093409 [Stylosanthes scabra]|uniref:Uncharacterized protein n=1 Tax=Stylosanthes scabra TaxID=79078 RepID=A0ABU6QW97_9FABA|nr:hypothetical protein [Stylosanthes scabra]